MNLTAFEQFIQVHERDIYSFCLHLTLHRHLADELYQDTVLQAFESMVRIDAGRNVKSYFFSIAIGKWKNARRKAGRRQMIAPTLPLEGLIEQGEGKIPEAKRSETPEQQFQKRVQREAIESGLSAMDDKFRIPLLLYYYDDCGLEEIAKIMKIPKGTVKSRLHKGRALIKEALIKEGFDHE